MTIDSLDHGPGNRPMRPAWRRSSHSGKEGNCVELAHLPGAATALRDSHDPDGPTLTYPANRLAAFLAATKDGAFDGFDV